jgi:methionyl-tRNA formyltransferase
VIRIVFMGTPQFAVPVLRNLIAVNDFEVVGVVTQPDRRRGRGQKITFSPVKKLALEEELPILQPKSLREEGFIRRLRGISCEVVVVAAYGKILPPQVLSLPPFGCINVHPSLLPKYRGPSPIAWAILKGEGETGVTLFLMDEGMDTGPILAQARCPISPQDTRESLSAKLSQIGANLLIETLPRWLDGEIEPQPQNESEATYTRALSKEDGLMDWSRPSTELWHMSRAYYPWPGTYTYWQGNLLKIIEAEPLLSWSCDEEPGTVVELDEGVAVVTGEGVLLLKRVQLAGKKAMEIEDFVRGRRGFVGAKLK